MSVRASAQRRQAPQIETSLRTLYDEWQKAKTTFNTDDRYQTENEAGQDLLCRVEEIEEAAASRMPQNIEDFAWKIIFADDDGEMNQNVRQHELVDMAYAIVGQAPGRWFVRESWDLRFNAADLRRVADQIGSAAILDTPILRLYREWDRLTAEGCVYVPLATDPREEDDEMERMFWEPRRRIGDQLMALPSTCAADFAAKVIVDTGAGNFLSDWDDGDLWVEARALTGAHSTATLVPTTKVGTASHTPIARLFAEWLENHRRTPETDEELKANAERCNLIIAEMAEIEPRTMADLAMLVIVGIGIEPDCPDEDMGPAFAIESQVRHTVAKAAGLSTKPIEQSVLPETEIMRAFRAWKESVDRENAEGVTDEEGKRLSDLRFAAENSIFAMPALDGRDVLAKIMIASCEGDCDPTAHTHGDAIFAEAAKVLGRSPEESEIMRLFRLSRHHHDLGQAIPLPPKGAPHEEHDKFKRLVECEVDLQIEAENAMLDCPARTMAELAAKVLAFNDFGENWLRNSDGGLRVLAELGALAGVEVPTTIG